MDPGDGYVLDLLAEIDQDAMVETSVDGDGTEHRAKYVYHVLRHADEPVSRSELLTMTGLPEPTVDRAIEQIRAEGLLNRTREPHDLRHVFYQIDRQ